MMASTLGSVPAADGGGTQQAHPLAGPQGLDPGRHHQLPVAQARGDQDLVQLKPGNLNRAQGHGTGRRVHDPHGGRPLAGGQGGGGDDHARVAAQLDGAGDRGAQPQGLRRVGQAHPDLEGTGHRVGLGRDLPYPASGRDLRVCAQGHGHVEVRVALVLDPGGDIEDRIAPALAGEAYHHPSGGHHLAGLGAAGRDHARAIGQQVRVGKLGLGGADLGLGRVHHGLGRVAGLDRLVEHLA